MISADKRVYAVYLSSSKVIGALALYSLVGYLNLDLKTCFRAAGGNSNISIVIITHWNVAGVWNTSINRTT